MKKLPEISDVILSVMEHNAPLVKVVYPNPNEGFAIDKALEFTSYWLDCEYTKARECFIAKIKNSEVTL